MLLETGQPGATGQIRVTGTEDENPSILSRLANSEEEQQKETPPNNWRLFQKGPYGYDETTGQAKKFGVVLYGQEFGLKEAQQMQYEDAPGMIRKRRGG